MYCFKSFIVDLSFILYLITFPLNVFIDIYPHEIELFCDDEADIV